MILGLGIDLVETARLRASHVQFGGRFIERILRPEEVAYCLAHRDPVPHFAARFAAKEAVAKAFGTGIGAALGWHDIEVCRKESGEPFLVLHGGGLALFAARGGKSWSLSLTHTEHYAAAVVILEG